MTFVRKGEHFMNNFDIIKLNEDIIKILIVMKTDDAPFEFIDELQEELAETGVSGEVVIDCLLHSGNTEERFISGYFDGESFDYSKFQFLTVARKSKIRNYMCEYLKSDQELLRYSGLTANQQKLIQKDCVL